MDRPMKVLLVEDLEESRTVLRAMNERLGHRVVEAAHGKEAVQVALDSNPDLVLMDLSMPEGWTAGHERASRHFLFQGRESSSRNCVDCLSRNSIRRKSLPSGVRRVSSKTGGFTDLDAALRRFLRTA